MTAERVEVTIFSDVHGNARALHQVLSRATDIAVGLGDYVAHRGDSETCLTLLRTPPSRQTRQLTMIKGGHDSEALAEIDDTLQLLDDHGEVVPHDFGLSTTSKEWLRALPWVRKTVINERPCAFIHGMPHDLDGATPIFDHVTADTAPILARHLGTGRVFIGHSHVPQIFVVDEHGSVIEHRLIDNDTEIDLGGLATVVIDVGSIGDSRHGPMPRCYVTWRPADDRLRFRVLPRLLNLRLEFEPGEPSQVINGVFRSNWQMTVGRLVEDLPCQIFTKMIGGSAFAFGIFETGSLFACERICHDPSEGTWTDRLWPHIMVPTRDAALDLLIRSMQDAEVIFSTRRFP